MTEILRVAGLVRYFGGVKALDGVDLLVQPGEVLGLIGPNGSGKTTLVNVVSGIYAPTAGRITFKGDSIDRLPQHRIARLGISRTFQNLRLFAKLEVLENVLIGAQRAFQVGYWDSVFRPRSTMRLRAEHEKRALEILEWVGIAQLAHLPASSLSQGDQRRVEIARALVPGPEVLLLDEPTAGLNQAEQELVVGLVQRIQSAGGAVVMVEHNLSVVLAVASRVSVLNEGRNLAEGAPDYVFAIPAVRQAYFGEEVSA